MLICHARRPMFYRGSFIKHPVFKALEKGPCFPSTHPLLHREVTPGTRSRRHRQRHGSSWVTFQGRRPSTLDVRSDRLCHKHLCSLLQALSRALAHPVLGTRCFWRGRGSCHRGEGFEPGDWAKATFLFRPSAK